MPWAAAGAAASAISGVAGSLISADASKSAARTQADAANRAATLAQQQAQQTRTDLSPFRLTGQSANTRLGNLFGLNTNSPNAPSGTVGDYLASAGSMNLPNGYRFDNSGGSLNVVDKMGNTHWANVSPATPIGDIFHSVAPDMVPVAPSMGGPQGGQGSNGPGGAPGDEQAFLEATPGYKFALSQGLKSVQNSAAARGLGTSGAALKGAAGFATGLADQTYQSNLLNPLMALSNLGENAAMQSGSLGQSGLANANALSIGGANASAAGTVGSANALAGGLNSLGSAPLNYQLYSKLLGSGGSSGGSGGGDFYDNTTTFAGPPP
jgi:hypothetical protein